MILFVRLDIIFFFNDTATTEIYTLSLHDALPISRSARLRRATSPHWGAALPRVFRSARNPVSHASHSVLNALDRKSTRLNSSHSQISYALFCLKKKIHLQARRTYPGLFLVTVGLP